MQQYSSVSRSWRDRTWHEIVPGPIVISYTLPTLPSPCTRSMLENTCGINRGTRSCEFLAILHARSSGRYNNCLSSTEGMLISHETLYEVKSGRYLYATICDEKSFNWELRSARWLSPDYALHSLLWSNPIKSVYLHVIYEWRVQMSTFSRLTQSESTVTRSRSKFFHGILPHLRPIWTRGFLAGEWNASDGNYVVFLWEKLVRLSYPDKDDSQIPSRIRRMRHERHSWPCPCTIMIPDLDTTLDTRGYWTWNL